MTDNRPVLKIMHLSLSVLRDEGHINILDDLSMEIRTGERWAIAGESGAGKSMTMYAITSLLPEKSITITGKILYREENGAYMDILEMPFQKRTAYCAGKVSLIFQDSINALNPFERIGKQWGDTICFHRPMMKKRDALQAMKDRLPVLGLSDPELLQKYPHQLSGGMRQRIAIAMALESEGNIIIADEPTTSLDAINQRNITQLIKSISVKQGKTLLYISHNLALLDHICTHVAIMQDGRIVEQGRREEVFYNPAHIYTKQLIRETRKLGVLKDGESHG